MYFSILTYILGTYYIVRNMFDFSYKTTEHLYKQDLIKLPQSKFEKINEVIYSTIHSFTVSTLSLGALTKKTFDYYNYFNIQLLTTENDNDLMILTFGLSLNYFIIDFFRCIYFKKYLFIVHHICAIQLLLFNLYQIKNQNNIGFYGIHTLFLLESNNILLNIGFLLKEYKFHYSITCTCWIIHLLFFVLFRLIHLPKIMIIYLLNDLSIGDVIFIVPSLIMIYSGSLYWSYRQVKGINKYLKENCVI